MHIPTLREDPAEAGAPSHRLLLRGGYIRQLMAGHYSLLPLAVRVRAKVIDIIRQEMDTGTRIVSENENFLTLAPYAPRFPFETWILPKQHESAFENSSSHMFENLARSLKDLLGRADRVLDNPPYNLVIHTSPAQDPTNDHYHWHIEFMPKLTKTAGFEWGTGFYINPTPPEEAAKFLREANVEEPAPVSAR